jgi:hypothetical protein
MKKKSLTSVGLLLIGIAIGLVILVPAHSSQLTTGSWPARQRVTVSWPD